MENKEQNTELEQSAEKFAIDNNKNYPNDSAQTKRLEIDIESFKAGASWQSSQPINSELTQLKAENESLRGEIEKLNEVYKGFNLDMGICLKILSDRRLSSTMKSLLEDLKTKQRNRLFIVKGITNP
jgi:hypothetical protein